MGAVHGYVGFLKSCWACTCLSEVMLSRTFFLFSCVSHVLNCRHAGGPANPPSTYPPAAIYPPAAVTYPLAAYPAPAPAAYPTIATSGMATQARIVSHGVVCRMAGMAWHVQESQGVQAWIVAPSTTPSDMAISNCCCHAAFSAFCLSLLIKDAHHCKRIGLIAVLDFIG